MIVLGIETSCDDSAVALVEDGQRVMAQRVHNQFTTHAPYQGVVPELAARDHLFAVSGLTTAVLLDANVKRSQIDAIAVTQGPGLNGSLLVGASFAKGMAVTTGKPLVPVNHVHAHMFAAFLDRDQPPLPALVLIVSGGHTNLYLLRDLLEFELLSHTRDDACGEAFDKVAKLLGIGYPGGPALEKRAIDGKARFEMPRVMQGRKDSFSYSGLKTHVANLWRESGKEEDIADLCYAFQEEAFRQLIDGLAAHLSSDVRSIIVAGGVAANQRFRSLLNDRFNGGGSCQLLFPPARYCTDNAAMIAAMGYRLLKSNGGRKYRDLKWRVFSNYFQPPS